MTNLIALRLDVGEYTATDAFRKIERHTCVAKADGGLVATTGPADDREAIEYAVLFAAAPALLAACKTALADIIESGGADGEAADELRAAIAAAEQGETT